MMTASCITTFSPLHDSQTERSDIQWDTERRTIKIGEMTIGLTATEFRLLFPLRHGVPMAYVDLAREAYQYRLDEKVRKMMDKHIDRIRGKLTGSGIYVYCVLGYGYLLFLEKPFDVREQREARCKVV